MVVVGMPKLAVGVVPQTEGETAPRSPSRQVPLGSKAGALATCASLGGFRHQRRAAVVRDPVTRHVHTSSTPTDFVPLSPQRQTIRRQPTTLQPLCTRSIKHAVHTPPWSDSRRLNTQQDTPTATLDQAKPMPERSANPSSAHAPRVYIGRCMNEGSARNLENCPSTRTRAEQRKAKNVNHSRPLRHHAPDPSVNSSPRN
jgi:hypothetical protein